MLNQDKLRTIFGLKIAYLRQQKSLSYQQLADAADLSMSYVHEIEKGKKYPKADKILLLAKALDSSYDELVSIHASKRLQPIIDLLESEFFKVFPMEMRESFEFTCHTLTSRLALSSHRTTEKDPCEH